MKSLLISLTYLAVSAAMPRASVVLPSAAPGLQPEQPRAGFAELDPTPLHLRNTPPFEQAAMDDPFIPPKEAAELENTQNSGEKRMLLIDTLKKYQAPSLSYRSKVRFIGGPNVKQSENIIYPAENLIDINPVVVAQDVQRRFSEIVENEKANSMSVAAPNPFSFNSGEPLRTIQPTVIDNPVNELDAMMEPVVVVTSGLDEQVPFGVMSKIPDTVKVNEFEHGEDYLHAVPQEYWRGGPVPLSLTGQYRPLPSYFRDSPDRDILKIPTNNMAVFR